MDKETLSNYGWIVICVLVLAVMIALASPFGNFVADAVKSTTQGLFDVNQNALDAAGIIIDDNGFSDAENDNIGGGYDHNAPELHPNDGTIPANGDIYTAGDYKYTYSNSNGGWSVAINTELTDKNQETYGPILESINGQPVTNMYFTFQSCKNLITAPVIPNSITIMGYTFQDCKNLVVAPVIPNGVTNLYGTFSGCKALTTAPEIPNSVTYMAYTFHNCTNLTSVSTIPSSVTNVQYTFYLCSSLKGTVDVPCTAQTDSFSLPSGLTLNKYHYTGCGH